MSKTSICSKSFVRTTGETGRHATGDVESVVFTFADDTKMSIAIDSLPESIGVAAMAHGIAQKVGDAYASAKKADDPLAWAKEQAETVIDNLKQGVWITVREGAGAPRVSMLLLAMEARADELGKAFDATAQQAKLVHKETGADYRKRVMANAGVKAHYERLRAEAQAARAAAAAAAVDGADDSDADDIF